MTTKRTNNPDTTGLMEGLTRAEAQAMAQAMIDAGIMYRRLIGKSLPFTELLGDDNDTTGHTTDK